MTRISFLYANREGSRFDIDYYVRKHMPWSIGLLKEHPGFKGVSVERGVPGANPTGPVFVAACHFLFDSFESFMAAVSPHFAVLQEDMKIYTDMDPMMQVGEVLISV